MMGAVETCRGLVNLYSKVMMEYQSFLYHIVQYDVQFTVYSNSITILGDT